MTATDTVRLHDLETLTVGDLVFTVEPPGNRTTIEVVVERDATLILKAPASATIERAEAFVASKRPWIYRKLALKDALVGPPVVKRFVNGEGFAYLGRSYRLRFDEASTVRLDRGRFLVPPVDGDTGASLMKDWYAETGQRWLRRRIQPWAARLGDPNVAVEVMDLGYRWGSARSTDETQRVNIHWATLQLPPSLIDYVLVHELAHLREDNHAAGFWSLVAQTMPGYEANKANLAAIGKSVWLGEVATDASE